jgi:protein ImuA
MESASNSFSLIRQGLAPVSGDRAARLSALRATLPEAGARTGGIQARALGDPGLDGALPWGGLPLGTVHEVAGAGPAERPAAGGFVAALAARLARANGGLVMWCVVGGSGQPGLPHGPGLAAFGLPPRSLLVVDARRRADALWAIEQGLRSPRLAVVVGELDRLALVEGRRLALAAEAGGGVALVLRGDPGEGEPSAAWTRWHVRAAPAGPGPFGQGLGAPRWQVSLARCRGAPPRDWLVEWQDEAHRLAVVAPLADRLPAARHAVGG